MHWADGSPLCTNVVLTSVRVVGDPINKHTHVWDHYGLHSGLCLPPLETHLRYLVDDIFVLLLDIVIILNFLLLVHPIPVVALHHHSANVLLMLYLFLVGALYKQIA